MTDSIPFLAVVLLASLGIVVASAGAFVRGAVSLAHRLSVPEFIVGSVIVAIGTSAPEVSINVAAALKGAGDIVISNIVGSNIVNIGLGIGLSAFLLSFDRARPEYARGFLVGGLGALGVLAVALLTENGGHALLSRPAAGLLLAVFAWFLWSSIRSPDVADDEPHPIDVPLPLAVAFLLGGVAAMAFFSDQAVQSAVQLAERAGIPHAVIGATIIAIGGSLPEIASCIAAARIRRPNLILGNIAGSSIFNIFGILGLSAMIRPAIFSTTLAIDIAILVGLTAIVMAALHFAPLRRFMGPIMLVGYIGYAGYLVAISL